MCVRVCVCVCLHACICTCVQRYSFSDRKPRQLSLACPTHPLTHHSTPLRPSPPFTSLSSHEDDIEQKAHDREDDPHACQNREQKAGKYSNSENCLPILVHVRADGPQNKVPRRHGDPRLMGMSGKGVFL